jgi:4-hydroxythreonine-4-phosphate dehydrogenase
MLMSAFRPIIAITMGDPVGIGPEIIHLALNNASVYEACRPLVIGDVNILLQAKKTTASRLHIHSVTAPETGMYTFGTIDVMNISELEPHKSLWGRPTVETGRAMVHYITAAIDMACQGRLDAITTCPINKAAMQIAGFNFSGHTELLAQRTQTDAYAMMLAGDRLRVVLVTIHVPLKDVPSMLTKERVLRTIEMTAVGLKDRFGCKTPCIAVAGLNPHAGEEGLFGQEEARVILPAIEAARRQGFNVAGPFPPDTLFYHAADGPYDAVVCMYHDQGLIPFKMIHFDDGVNITLGLPIIRTSVDHGTAYDISGTGKAHPGSLVAAINMAADQALHVFKNKSLSG